MKINAEQGPALDHKGICKLPLRVRCRKIKLQLKYGGFLVFAGFVVQIDDTWLRDGAFAEFGDFAVRGCACTRREIAAWTLQLGGLAAWRLDCAAKACWGMLSGFF